MDSPITFQGTGTDPEDGNLTGANLSWSSSTDGAFGTGTSFSFDGFTVGDHTITLTAVDNGALVVAGDSNQGLLVPQIESGHQGAPHGTTIVQNLKDWIDAGALDN